MQQKNYQKGFGVVEIIIVVVSIVLVGAVGWYVWGMNQKQATNAGNTAQNATPVQSPNTAIKTFGLANGKVNFTLPSGWSDSPQRSSSCPKTIESAVTCLESGSVYPNSVTKVDDRPLYSVTVSVYKHDDTTTSKQWWVNDYKGDNGATIVSGQIANASTTAINGYDTYSFELNRDDGSVTDYTIVTNSSYVTLVTSIPKQHVSSGNAVSTQDYSQYLNDTKQFIASIKFQ
ncbi:MAG TPA: hypothetical protein VLG40_00010 [Candidatus Saccharimonas sp.]|nr:hypothetical protein [Candidatus Saccharimonas sp.]